MSQFRMTEEQFAARMGKRHGKGAIAPALKKSKFGNKKTPAADGVVMDSGREATRYKDLFHMQQMGQIEGLRRQVEYPLEVNGVLVCVYVADFVYIRRDDSKQWDRGTEVVEDSKGHRTPLYKIKRALMLACHGIKVLET